MEMIRPPSDIGIDEETVELLSGGSPIAMVFNSCARIGVASVGVIYSRASEPMSFPKSDCQNISSFGPEVNTNSPLNEPWSLHTCEDWLL